MRVTMYAEDYEPICVIDVSERDLDILRRGAGDHFQYVPRIRVNWARASDPVGRDAILRQYTVRLDVEGMRWADGSVRHILVVYGLRLSPEFVQEGDRLDHVATCILREALNCAARRLPPEPARIGQGFVSGAIIASGRGASIASGAIQAYSITGRARINDPAADWPTGAVTAATAPAQRQRTAMDVIRVDEILNAQLHDWNAANVPSPTEEIIGQLRQQAPDMVGVRVRQEGAAYYAQAVRPGDPEAEPRFHPTHNADD